MRIICNEEKKLILKDKIMKSSNWVNVENAIFFTTQKMGWEKNWEMLTFKNGVAVTDIDRAKKEVRKNMKEINVGLATFDQMSLNNAQWDNL